jgi:uncharacterized protein YraI
MIKQTPVRFHAGIIALVVMSLVLAACGGAATPASASITTPTQNASFQAGEEVKIEGLVTGSAVTQVDIFVNGAKFATIDKTARPNEFDVSVAWTAPADTAGSNVIQLKGLDSSGKSIVSSDAVFITIEAQPTPTPEPTLEPTPIPTVAALTPAPQAAQPTAAPVLIAPKPENDFVNVRAGPDINAQRLGQLNKGQSAPVRGKSTDGKWFQITFPGAPDGAAWVLGDVAQVTGDVNVLPVVQASTAVTGTVSTTATVPTTNTVPTAPITTTAPGTATLPAGLQPPFVRLIAGQDFANVRTGPDVAYEPPVGRLNAATSAAAVKGKSANGLWWQILFPSAPGGVAWVFGQLVTLTGDANAIPVVQAPPLPTPAVAPTAAAAAPAAPTATSIPAVPATPTVAPAALLPYSQNMRFAPRDDIGDVPLGHQGESKSSTLQWQINGATRAELEIVAKAGQGIWGQCAAGNLGTVSPNDAAGKRLPLQLPSGEYNFSITGQGYYEFTIYVTKADGSTTTIPRAVIVDCYKTQ